MNIIRTPDGWMVQLPDGCYLTDPDGNTCWDDYLDAYSLFLAALLNA